MGGRWWSAEPGDAEQGIHVNIREVVQCGRAALHDLVLSEVRRSVNLEICVADNPVDLRLQGERGRSVLVEDVVVTRPIEEVDDGAPRVCWYPILLILEHVAIHLGSSAPIQVDDLDSEAHWLEQDVDQEHDAEMVDLLVGGVEPLLAVPFYAEITLYKVLVDGGVALQPRTGQHAQVVDDGIGYLGVVEPLEEELLCSLRRALHRIGHVPQKAQGLGYHVFEEPFLDPAHGGDEVVEGREARDLLLQSRRVPQGHERFEVGEAGSYIRSASALAAGRTRPGSSRVGEFWWVAHTPPSTVPIAQDRPIVRVFLWQRLSSGQHAAFRSADGYSRRSWPRRRGLPLRTRP